jgi:hypothetical protein
MGAWLHGTLHIQEGDLEDAEYWYGKAHGISAAAGRWMKN